MEFEAWPKIPRLHRDMVITEKIDGTNACIGIYDVNCAALDPATVCAVVKTDGAAFGLWAQSRKRIITPGKQNDNAGFAAWVAENAEALVHLGAGRHYGEWWGQGIQRGYGLDHKRFSLFNTERDSYRAAIDGGVLPDNVDVVPVLERYTFDHARIHSILNLLREGGSLAAREAGVAERQEAEGIVVFHAAARQPFKVTLENDESPKGATS